MQISTSEDGSVDMDQSKGAEAAIGRDDNES